MGDPRTLKRKYSRPGHPWQRKRIDEEKILMRDYGLKSKRELWKVNSSLKLFAGQAKRLTALRTQQSERERKQLLDKLARLGLLAIGKTLDDVLALNIKHLLERRLQTLVLRKGLARTATQARQMIVHGHILVGNKQVSAPSYLVPLNEESQLCFNPNSGFIDLAHPERTIKKNTKTVSV